jgi:hypothetical protein
MYTHRESAGRQSDAIDPFLTRAFISISACILLGWLRARNDEDETHSAIDTPVCIIRVIETPAGRGREQTGDWIYICAGLSSHQRATIICIMPPAAESYFIFIIARAPSAAATR